ncbi:MAG: cytochrome P460 family protein [Acidobacteriota bacterium]|nr:cytochrome P460 family protein [Acidobacteriota bacterium]
MSRQKKLLAAGALLLCAACCAFALASASAQKRAAAFAPAESEEAKALKLFSGHRKWTLVNPARARMDGAVAALCRAPTAAESGRGSAGPHALKYLSVYVNDAGAKAMTEKGAEFPRGSIIVKEKFGARAGGAAELMTAMVKREAGFNPESGDWEFFVVNGEGTRVQASGRLENCMACHAGQKDSDYTFRTYLTPRASL